MQCCRAAVFLQFHSSVLTPMHTNASQNTLYGISGDSTSPLPVPLHSMQSNHALKSARFRQCVQLAQHIGSPAQSSHIQRAHPWYISRPCAPHVQSSRNLETLHSLVLPNSADSLCSMRVIARFMCLARSSSLECSLLLYD